MSRTIFVLDSGGGSCRLGVASDFYSVQEFPNCSAKVKGERRTLVGPDILGAKDVSSLILRRPVDRGYVVSWHLQQVIWRFSLKKLFPQTALSSSGIVVTEPYMNLPELREQALRTLFDELGFASLVLLPPAVLSLRYFAHKQGPTSTPALRAGCALVVDAGFSFTHAVPIFDWHVVQPGVRRVDIGGKAMTNYLKDLVSYRSINMSGESYLVEHIKDSLCFVSQHPEADLALARRRPSPFRTEWLLPDGVTSTWGRKLGPDDIRPAMKKDGSVLVVNNERFMVPEILFHPADIGMDEGGIAEACAEAVTAVHPNLHGLLFSNVLVIGAVAKCPGFKQRLESELRPLVPDDYSLTVHLLDDPHLAAWRGGALLAQSEEYQALAVTRTEWRRHGVAACGKWEEA